MELSQMAANPTVWQKFTGMLTAGGNPLAYALQMAAKAADNITAVNAQFELEIQNLKDGLASYDETIKRIDRLSKSATSTTVVTAGSGIPTSASKTTRAKENKTALPPIEKGKASDYEVKPVADVFEEPDMNGALKEGLVPLEGEHAGKQHDLRMREIQGQISPDQANLEKLAAEEQYLMARLMLEQTYNESTIQTQQQLNDNLMAQQEERATQDVEQKQRMRLAEQDLAQARRDAMMQGVDILKSFVAESSVLYKGLFLAQKAMAMADIFIKLRQEIAGIYASNAAFGPAGAAFATMQSTAAKVRAGISIAAIGAQTIQCLIPKKAQGGYTDVRSLAEGFVDRATLYSMPNRNYIAGEAGREFILNNTALQQPAVANFANMMDAIQKSKNYGLLGGLDRAPTPGTTRNDTAILNELTRLNTNMAALAQRPIRFSHDKFRDFEDFMDQVFEETRV